MTVDLEKIPLTVILLQVDTSVKGGGGFTLIIFVKLDFEIAVDQQTNARDRTFEGVTDSGCPPVSAGQPRPY